jgi:membrane-associated phospholipid phosphatase
MLALDSMPLEVHVSGMRVHWGPPRAAIALVVWLACVAPPARAGATDERSAHPSRLDQWTEAHSEWLLGQERFEPSEVQRLWVLYAIMGSGLAVLEFGAQPPRDARWEGDNGFDDGIRDVLKGASGSARSASATASDVLFGGLGVALLLDEIWLRHENPALKSLLFDGSWLLANELVTRAAKVSAGRERPYVDPCGTDPDYVSDCDEGRDRNASFFSGHASTTATMAGLVCSHHLHRAASGWFDWAACGGAAAASAAAGVLRVTAEKHHATDVLAGWASGVLFGYILPSHFDRRIRTENRALSLIPMEPVVTPNFLGLRLQYSF